MFVFYRPSVKTLMALISALVKKDSTICLDRNRLPEEFVPVSCCCKDSFVVVDVGVDLLLLLKRKNGVALIDFLLLLFLQGSDRVVAVVEK